MRFIAKAIMMLAALSPLAATAAAPSGYYSRLEGLSGQALRKAAKSIVRSHTVVSYGDDTWDAFKKTDTRTVNGQLVYWDMYSSNNVTVSSNHEGMNIEHSVANSWWGKTKNDAYKDLFHLNPSDKDANSRKSNYPIGEIGTRTWDNGVTFIGKPKSGSGGGCAYVYEPADMYKGDFARVFFYMFTVYDDLSWKSNTAWMYSVSGGTAELEEWAYTMMLKWADADPVSEKEVNRNDAIYGIQHNRNPFIDLPHLADYIWGAKKNQPFHLDGSEEPVVPDPIVPDPVEPDPTEPDDVFRTLMACDWDQSTSMSTYLSQGWENYVEEGNFSGWYVKTFQNNNYATGSAYKGTGSGPFTAWLISPEFSLADGSESYLTFRTQGAYGVPGTSLEAYLLDGDRPSDGATLLGDAKICVPNPDGSSVVYCDWVQSGKVDLSGYTGTKRVAFKYRSEGCGSGNSATYCLDDVKVESKKGASVSVTDFDAAESVQVAPGMVITTPGVETRVFDLSGRLVAVDSDGCVELPAGLYIVVCGKAHPQKVVVR